MKRRLRSVSVSGKYLAMEDFGKLCALTSAVRVEIGEAAVELKKLVHEPGGPLSWRRILDGWLCSWWKRRWAGSSRW